MDARPLLDGTRRMERLFSDAERVALAKDNHIWLNAFACVRPSTDFLEGIGGSVLSMLDASPMVDDLIGKTAVVYIRVNRS